MRRYTQSASEIKEAINPYKFYLREQNLSKYGYRSGKWAVAGLCPFHDDSEPGSFKVNIDTGAFKCWSCGEGGGDIISFLQKRDNLGFLHSLMKLSEEWGVS